MCIAHLYTVVCHVGILFGTGTPQNPASNTAAASITTAQQSTPPTASTGSVGGQQATPGSSLADITPSVRTHVCVHVYGGRGGGVGGVYVCVCMRVRVCESTACIQTGERCEFVCLIFHMHIHVCVYRQEF